MILSQYSSMNKLIILIIVLGFNQITAQNILEYRPADTLELMVDKENYAMIPIEKSTYFVEGKALQLFSGDSLLVHVEIKNDSIYSMKVVKEIIDAKATIAIQFNQMIRSDSTQSMQLKVQNPFDKSLDYDAFMITPYNDGWRETSIIPVYPGIFGIELWPDVIISLILDNWKLLD